MSLLSDVLTPSTQSPWGSYVESANQSGHAYLGQMFALAPCLLWGWWGVAVPLAISAAWEVFHRLRHLGGERQGASNWDAFKDFVSHAPGACAAGFIAQAARRLLDALAAGEYDLPSLLDATLWDMGYATACLVWGLLQAGLMGIIWQRTDRNA